MALALVLAAGVVQVGPLVGVEGGAPVLCGYVYRDSDGLELRVEKGVRGDSVFTAVEVRGAAAIELRTASFDSQRDLKPVAGAAPGGVRLEADLQDADAGGMLFAELGVSGGTLRVARATPAGRGDAATETGATIDAGDAANGLQWSDLALPAPLPRDVTAMYLNCAGDLIRPD